jgi:DNA-directed RNA polymerase subunit RPC12/RpoP
MEYRCFMCNKTVGDHYLRKRIHCPYCGSKMIFKPRTVATKVKAI